MASEPARTLPRSLSQSEIDLVEEELAANGYPELPGEIEVCKMVKVLQGKLTTELTSLDLALYLRARQPPTAPPAHPPAFFKQFADPVRADEPPRPKAEQRPKREYVCRSKRKVRPSECCLRRQLQEVVEACDASTADCGVLFERKRWRGHVGPAGALHERCHWVFHEYFYSFFDRAYLKDEDSFARLHHALALPDVIPYSQARALRQALPKPRLFNAEFLAGEVERLNDFRNQARAAPKQRGRGQWQVSVGRQVTAVHPVCGHLHSGSILAIYKQNLYMVKFSRPQLGTQKVLDVNIAVRQVAHPHRVVVEAVNFEVMALVIRLLEFKADLIALLGRYNDLAQQVQREENALDNRFYQQYGWIGATVNILSLGIRHILSRFRLRGLDSANQERIGRNFANVLLNPLNLMEKELDKSSENSDLNASHQIKRIISTYKESKVDQYSRELFGKHWEGWAGREWEEREELEVLLRCMVGILVSLRVEHKAFSIEENKYLKELMNHFDSQFPEHFNEIYELLASITAKLNDDPK